MQGIYVGNNMVIYLQEPSKGSSPACQQCGYDRNCSGRIIKTCLDCFLDGHNIDFHNYGGLSLEFIRERSKRADEVIKKATYFIEANVETYKSVAKNCQDFAVYCKTGKAFSIDEQLALLQATGSGPTCLGGFQDYQ
ncbi:hypothetical protein COLO4_15382 [Corchorus olitorius]|uniref:LRAT domain-containing protein n=1 Tax=Corchorus olitorius TaxID=93759 RepID=A0A1R3JN08_9ROSI|nr:hypothetical protein COLO4_15382 [Corchorus olitorius]